MISLTILVRKHIHVWTGLSEKINEISFWNIKKIYNIKGNIKKYKILKMNTAVRNACVSVFVWNTHTYKHTFNRRVDSRGFIQCQFILSTFIQSTLLQPTLYQAISIFLNPFVVCGTGRGGGSQSKICQPLVELEGWFLRCCVSIQNLLLEKEKKRKFYQID